MKWVSFQILRPLKRSTTIKSLLSVTFWHPAFNGWHLWGGADPNWSFYCPYRHVVPKQLFQRRLSGFHYYFYTLLFFLFLWQYYVQKVRRIGRLQVIWRCKWLSPNVLTIWQPFRKSSIVDLQLKMPFQSILITDWLMSPFLEWNTLQTVFFKLFGTEICCSGIPTCIPCPICTLPIYIFSCCSFCHHCHPLCCLARWAFTTYKQSTDKC